MKYLLILSILLLSSEVLAQEYIVFDKVRSRVTNISSTTLDYQSNKYYSSYTTITRNRRSVDIRKGVYPLVQTPIKYRMPIWANGKTYNIGTAYDKTYDKTYSKAYDKGRKWASFMLNQPKKNDKQ